MRSTYNMSNIQCVSDYCAMEIRPYCNADQNAVRALFIEVNRLLAPPGQEDRFEQYILRSLHQEIDQIMAYYAERNGGFWVAVSGDIITGMFGLEQPQPGVFELRRMYVDPRFRRQGIARRLLENAEAICREKGATQIFLSTSELQQAALALYRRAGYQEAGEEHAEEVSNKTVGGGIRRFHFTKEL